GRDEAVGESLEKQDMGFRWRARRSWHAAWADQTPRWERKVELLRREMVDITDAFIQHAQQDGYRFAQRVRDLYRPRTGGSYLLPPQGNDLEPFYQAVLRRFVSLYVAQDRLRPTATEADVVNEIVGAEIWRRAYTDGWQHGPAQAVARVRDRLKQEVKRLFQHRDLGGE